MFNNLFKRNTASIETLAAAEAARLHGRPDVVFVDVRGADEIARSGTIRGALRAPLPGLANFAKPQGGGLLPAVDSGKKIVLVCASGMRSGVAAQQLAGMGYDNLANLRGGFGQWVAAGGPIER
ncbi:MAG: rhodanese-like domain-containing protein [Devosia sp.]|nr:rhodanese-like domain-containing protein [Devosia sp.]